MLHKHPTCALALYLFMVAYLAYIYMLTFCYKNINYFLLFLYQFIFFSKIFIIFPIYSTNSTKKTASFDAVSKNSLYFVHI